jgi:hypothetical protein
MHTQTEASEYFAGQEPQRESSKKNRGTAIVYFWHEAEIPAAACDVCFRKKGTSLPKDVRSATDPYRRGVIRKKELS